MEECRKSGAALGLIYPSECAVGEIQLASLELFERLNVDTKMLNDASRPKLGGQPQLMGNNDASENG